jgi:hypothetical protein
MEKNALYVNLTKLNFILNYVIQIIFKVIRIEKNELRKYH